MNIFGVSFPIDLIPIPMKQVCVIIGMDWLSHFGAMIDCECQRVVVRTLSSREPIVYGEGTKVGSGFFSVAKARQYILHGCVGFLAYVVDTRARDQISISEVLLVRVFADVFPEELLGIPPERQVKFRIDLVPVRPVLPRRHTGWHHLRCRSCHHSCRNCWASSSFDLAVLHGEHRFSLSGRRMDRTGCALTIGS